jgi:hypothetical protein
MVGILADGTLIAGVFAGLSVSRNGGCDWTLEGGGLTDRYVVDLSVERNDPSRAVLVISNGVGPGQFLTQLWETTNSGGAWTQAGVDLPSDFLAVTVDPAPSDPARVYASGRFGAPDYAGAIQRTSNRGQTWESLLIPGVFDPDLPFLSAVDPNDPDVLYVRVDVVAAMSGEPSDLLMVSPNGGETWTTAFEGQGDLLGFALSPDGATVLVGGPQAGLWSAPAATLAFEKISDVGVKCLTWTLDGLVACGDEFRDGFVVGRSVDGGKTFTPILHLSAPCGPLVCDADSGVATICADLWGATQLTIDADGCQEPAAPPPPPPSDEGCGVRGGDAGAGTAWMGLGAIAAAALLGRSRAWARRRRVARRSCQPRGPDRDLT